MSRGPGKWQRLILAELAAGTPFRLAARFSRNLARRLSPPELSALHRAAHTLARQGKATLAVLWSEYPGRRLVTVIGPPGCTVNGVPLPELSVDHGPGGTRSAFKGSLRDLAREERVSVATARRDLAEAGRPAGGRRGGTGGKGKGD